MTPKLTKDKPYKPAFWFIFLFFVISSLFDILSTLWFSNFLSLETNPTILLTNVSPIFIIFAVKLFLIGVVFLSFTQSKKFNSTDTSKFFWISLIVLLIFLQCFAGFSNINTIKRTTNKINIEYNESYKPNEIPDKVLDDYKAPTKVALKSYFSLILGLFLSPLIFSVIVFILWKKSWI